MAFNTSTTIFVHFSFSFEIYFVLSSINETSEFIINEVKS